MSRTLSRDGRRFAAATNEAGQVQVWDPDTQQYRTYALRDQSLAEPIVAVCDGASGRELHRLRGHTELVTAMAFSPGADRLVAVSADRALIWDVGRGSIIAALEGAQGGLDRVAYSEDGAHIVGGRVQDDTVWFWPAKGGAPQSSDPFRQFNELLRVDDRVSLRAYASGSTTVFEAKASGARIGLFPVALQRLTRHPRRPLWAGTAGRHVYLLVPEDFVATSWRPDFRDDR